MYNTQAFPIYQDCETFAATNFQLCAHVIIAASQQKETNMAGPRGAHPGFYQGESVRHRISARNLNEQTNKQTFKQTGLPSPYKQRVH
jgi:hypothetical protein